MSFVWKTLSKGKQRDYGIKQTAALSPKYIMISRFYDGKREQWLNGVKSWESRNYRFTDWEGIF